VLTGVGCTLSPHVSTALHFSYCSYAAQHFISVLNTQVCVVIDHKFNQTCGTIKHGALHFETERERGSESERYSRIDSDNARARGGERACSLHCTCLLQVAQKMSATRSEHISHPLLLSSKCVVLSERGQATWTCMPSSASCLSPYNCP